MGYCQPQLGWLHVDVYPDCLGDAGGSARALGAQAGITLASALLIVLLQTCGKQLRQTQGRMELNMIK